MTINKKIKQILSSLIEKIKLLFPNRYFVICCFVFFLFCWNATGTLAPYANTSTASVTCSSCKYLINIDHFNFQATFDLIDGKEKSTYENSVVLRRILFPVIAYPFMKILGFYYGGIIASILINFTAIFGFSAWLYKKTGKIAGIVTLVLLVSMPGLFYWVGLPYSYTLIVPSTLFLYYLFLQISVNSKLKSQILYCFLIGIIFLGYDLWIFFLPALLIFFLTQNWKRGWLTLICLLPSLTWNFLLSTIFNIPFSNSNSNIYGGIVDAYLNVPQHYFDYLHFLSYLKRIITILFSVAPNVFLYSNFIALPILFIFSILFNVLIKKYVHLLLIEKVILFSILLVFLVINLTFKSPKGWNLSGDWIARLYQPLFVVYITYLARTANTLNSTVLPRIRHAYFVLVSFAVLFNVYVMFGFWIESTFTSSVYYHFYKHSTQTAQIEMINKYGIKPIGFCESLK